MKEKLTRAQQFQGAAVAMLAINLSSSFSRIYRLEQKVPVDQIVSDSSLLISCFFSYEIDLFVYEWFYLFFDWIFNQISCDFAYRGYFQERKGHRFLHIVTLSFIYM